MPSLELIKARTLLWLKGEPLQRTTQGYMALLFLLALFYFAPGLLSPRSFWVPDEVRFAEVVQQMLHHGHWLAPQLGNGPFLDMLPAYFWISAWPAALLGGITPFAFLIVTWLCSVGILAGIYLLADEFFDRPAVGLMSGLLFMSSMLAVWGAQSVNPAMLSTLGLVFAMYAFYRGYRRRSYGWYVGFYAFAALAVLSGNLAGLLIPLAAVLCFLLHRKQWKEIGKLLLNPGLLLFGAVVGGWLGWAWLAGNEAFAAQFARLHFSASAFGYEQWSKALVYLLLCPAAFLPWTAFLPQALRSVFRGPSDGTVLCAWWLAAGLAAVTALRGQGLGDLLFVVPALSLIGGIFMRGLYDAGDAENRPFLISSCVAAFLCFGLASLLPLLALFMPVLEHATLWILPCLFVPLLALAVLWGWMGRSKPFVVTLFLGLWLFSACFAQLFVYELDSFMTTKDLASAAARMKREGRTVAAYGVPPGWFVFYAGGDLKELSGRSDLRGFCSRKGTVILMSSRDLHHLGQCPYRVLTTDQIAGREYVLLLGDSGGSAADSEPEFETNIF
jgi:4-amino-4-deoxy-L-arabinose transferase-like glycosyltransferase